MLLGVGPEFRYPRKTYVQIYAGYVPSILRYYFSSTDQMQQEDLPPPVKLKRLYEVVSINQFIKVYAVSINQLF